NTISLPTPRRSRVGHSFRTKLHLFQPLDGRIYKSGRALVAVPNPFPTIYSLLPLSVATDSPADQSPLAHALLSISVSGQRPAPRRRRAVPPRPSQPPTRDRRPRRDRDRLPR